jgi:hypothetical protein
MKPILLLSALLCSAIMPAFAQKEKVKKDPWTSTELWEPIPINRQLAHDKIDRLQKKADQADGKDDSTLTVKNSADTKLLNDAAMTRVDQLQIIIENLPLDHWKKVRYLMALEEDLKNLPGEMQAGNASGIYYRDLVQIFEDLFRKQEEGEPLVDYINSKFSRAIYGSMHMFREDKPAVAAVYTNMVKRYPDEMMQKFYEFSEQTAAEDLMAAIAPQKPNLIMTYATSTSAERNAVRRCKDPLVKKIVEIADNAKSPLRAITFLDELHAGTLTIAQVNNITADNALYYKQLVLKRNTPSPLTRKVLDRETQLMALEYVRTMNELHDSPDPVRFKCIEPLNAREMYFLMVLCSDEIYTSTFVGTFNRMLTKMAPQKGDAFLKDLGMDKFRTFIRMSAGYNKLSAFLQTMDLPNRNELMSTFVRNIDKNRETDIEDAVDVADAFGSITDLDLLYYLLDEAKKEYERTYLEDNRRGLITYFLLHTLCTSILDTESSSDELQAQLKIPPISFVPNRTLLDAGGTVYQQVFFYGDEDGKASYASFMSNYKPTEWKIEKNESWVTLSSLSGKPTMIYANLPLDEPQDEEAQKKLIKHLEEKNIKPTVVVHRGHSYHLPTTLKYLSPDDKVIILGSCGGYHNLSTILGTSQDAHIISSKQTGTMLVTDPILNAVNKRILEGRDLNWPEIWTEVGGMMKTPALQDKFNDYVPPHKNMGALFLKAFKIQMEENRLM